MNDFAVQFELVEFHQGRNMRGAPAARVSVTMDGEAHLLWMTASDAQKNRREFGEHPELDRVLEAYRIGRLPNLLDRRLLKATPAVRAT